MPLLAGTGVPVVDTPTFGVDLFADSRTLSLRSLDGSDLLPFTGNEFFARQGVEGLDLPPVEVLREKVAGMEGTRITDVQVGEREVFLPYFMRSPISHADFLDRRDRIAALLDYQAVDYRANSGTLDLVADSIRGERSLRCIYLEGMPGRQAVDSGGAFWESVGLKLLAVQPYWRGERWSTPPIYKAEDVSFFGAFPPHLSASRALGEDIPITVPGDAPSWVEVNLVGPATSVQVTGSRLSVSIPGGVAVGETVTIRTDPRDRDALFNGVRDWSRIAPSDRYNPMLPGEQMVSVVVTGPTADTVATVSGWSNFKRWC